MEYSLFALLAILIIFPAAFIVIYYRRRAFRRSRLADRQRFNNLVEFDRARRAQQWAAVPADGIPGIVLRNVIDAETDPLRQAPPAAFAEVAPGIWRSTRTAAGATAAAAAATSSSSQAEPFGGNEIALESNERGGAGVEAHTPYGNVSTAAAFQNSGPHLQHNTQADRGNENIRTISSEEDSGVVGRPLFTAPAAGSTADTMPDKVHYGEATYIARTASNASECAVEPAFTTASVYTPLEKGSAAAVSAYAVP